MTSSISSASARSPITLAAGFLGAFIVGSLAVQLVRSQTASVQAGAVGVEPVIAGPAALWAPLAERDIASANTQPQRPNPLLPSNLPLSLLWAPKPPSGLPSASADRTAHVAHPTSRPA